MSNVNEWFDGEFNRRADAEMYYSLYGKVTSVDLKARTCDIDPVGDTAERSDIRLQAVTGSSTGVVIVPKVDSFVGVSFVNKSTGFVVMTSEVEEILIDTEKTTYNGGDNGGLIKISDLITKLNNVEDDINNLKKALAAWVPVTQDGGAALKLALATYYTKFLVPTQKIELEDTKITH